MSLAANHADQASAHDKKKQSARTVPGTKKIWWAVALLGLGIAAIYLREYFGMGGRGFFRALGGMSLLAALILNAIALICDFRRFPITYWGTGLAFLLVALRMYVMIEAVPDTVKHLSTAKWMVLFLFPLGIAGSVYGVFLQSELRATGVEQPEQKWKNTELLNGLIVGVNFLALFVLANQFVLQSWW